MNEYIRKLIILFALGALMGMVASDQDEDIPHNEVRNWALKFGVDLWEFGRQFTKMNEIKNKYQDIGGEILRKDGIILLRELASEVKNFMDYKMNAVLRVMDSAEQAALSEHDPAQSNAQTSYRQYDSRHLNDFMSIAERNGHPHSMRRFEDLIVNLTHSAIMTPDGISAKDPALQSTIAWSSHLDPIFANNLERDPALSWQYFGSRNGFLRRFPGTAWPHEATTESKPISDFRSDEWFIQAVTYPKDVMILLDSSGSMSGKSFELAITTVYALLDTLSDNDFVNVIAFSDSTKSVVPCFKDKMVRAYPDNIKEMKDAVKAIKCENVANFTSGFEYAFEILHRYNQSSQGSQCNQAIMLVTDGTSDTHSEIIKHYNWPHMPVRIFTYLIGGGSGSRESMHNIACSNKGYYVQINSVEDAKKKSNEYAFVMSRPTVLYQADHPIHWSPVYLGGRTGSLAEMDHKKRRLVTTVSTPVFDKRNHSTRSANVLGVVATDVPIEEIVKLVPQHKLGANGYSFVLDNNGRVLYHPDLRIADDKMQYVNTLKPTYSSVDLTEVELPEMDYSTNNIQYDEAREDENSNLLLDMRNEMVHGKEGEMEFSLLTHFDNMKRISIRAQKYFYGPIEGTPFTLAIVLPEAYGMNEFHSQVEIRHSHQNVTEYLKGNNWRVNPDWVYCEYNSLYDFVKERDSSGEATTQSDEQAPQFDTAEDQILHFLARAGRPRWKWHSLRPRSSNQHANHGPMNINNHHGHHGSNGDGLRKAEPYYCDRNLIQSLVRDAMVTDSLDQPSHSPRKEDKQKGYQMFTVKLSFVATRSGLLRWVDHIPHNPDSAEMHFGEENAKAQDQSWFQRAVDQHSIEADSFVFSVPFDSGYSSKSNATLVTASHAIFLERRGHNKAPVAVVGLQFQHDSLSRHFINITSACTGSGSCRKTCASDELDCYLLDNNGFVLLSESTEHTGKFFGHIDGTIMDSLVQDRIYRRVSFMDYQGLCSDRDNPYNGAAYSIRPNAPMAWLYDYAVAIGFYWLSIFSWQVQAWPQFDAKSYQPDDAIGDASDGNYLDEYDEDATDTNTPAEPINSNVEKQTPPPKVQTQSAPQAKVVIDSTFTRPCDLKTDLYILQPERLNTSTPLKGKLTNCHVSGCERPFSVQKVPHSNLILLVVDTLCACGSKQLDITPHEIPSSAVNCASRRASKDKLPRKRPKKCINYHPEEIEIQQCGRAPSYTVTSTLLAMVTIFSQIWTATSV